MSFIQWCCERGAKSHRKRTKKPWRKRQSRSWRYSFHKYFTTFFYLFLFFNYFTQEPYICGSCFTLSLFLYTYLPTTFTHTHTHDFRAEKRSAQACAHPLSQAQGGLFCWCVCLSLREFWLRLNEMHKVWTFASRKVFLPLCGFSSSSLANYFGLRTTDVKAKTEHSVSLRWNKTFWPFPTQRGEYFSDCAFDLFVSWFRLLSPAELKPACTLFT